MSLSRLKSLVLLAPLGAPLLACGPYFPATILDTGDAGLLTLPSVALDHTLAEVPLPAPGFTACPPSGEDSAAIDTLAAELHDLAAAGLPQSTLTRVAALRQNFDRIVARQEYPFDYDPALPNHYFDDLPAEFARYLTGALALRAGDTLAARRAFASVLDLPTADRHYKSVWAAYMLGRLAATSGDRTAALTAFAHTRDLARAGFADTAGLATASLGEEARVHFAAHEWLAATRLYLAEHAAGHPSAVNSLRFTALAALTDPAPETLPAFAADPACRAVITAVLLERGTPPPWDNVFDSPSPAAGDAPSLPPDRRWLAALEHVRVTDSAEATRFAFAAYESADYPAATRWLALAPADSVPARWLRAKLDLRAGRIDEATTQLAALVHARARPFGRDDCAATLEGELATLHVGRGDYTEALRLLLHAGYWEDAAYLAERVLTLDELTAFARTLPPAKSADAPAADPASPATDDDPDLPASLRALLGRRLVRAGRDADALAWLPATESAALADYDHLLATGRDASRPAPARGLALFRAARILREHGLELRGAELSPDFAIWQGEYTLDSFLSTRVRAGGVSTPTDDEIARALASDIRPNLRFHYRQLAADLAWEAAALLPDNSTELASLLTEAGGWLKARDPQAADRFYKALVKRCPDTDAGREARRRHWFPDA